MTMLVRHFTLLRIYKLVVKILTNPGDLRCASASSSSNVSNRIFHIDMTVVEMICFSSRYFHLLSQHIYMHCRGVCLGTWST